MKYIIPLVLLFLQGCTWVELTPLGESVRIVDSTAASDCARSGYIFVSSRIEAGGFYQKEERLNSQLEALARNDAAASGNAIVLVEESMDGMNRIRTYDVYQC